MNEILEKIYEKCRDITDLIDQLEEEEYKNLEKEYVFLSILMSFNYLILGSKNNVPVKDMKDMFFQIMNLYENENHYELIENIKSSMYDKNFNEIMKDLNIFVDNNREY